MAEPVKLSRERWEMLRCERGTDMAPIGSLAPVCITLERPTEIDGITFLPAEYVPGGADRVARVQRLSPPPCA